MAANHWSRLFSIRNLVIITGDPPKMGDYPFATPVYDVDSIGLLRIAAAMNAGVDPAGKEIVFACRSGKRSVTASLAAQDAGLPYNKHLAGGIIGWKAAGLSTKA